MKLELDLAQEFGPRLADGAAAAAFRHTRLDPYASICEQIVLDFTGVRLANSSFTNALVSGFVEQHGPQILQKVLFKGCNPLVRVLVESAISLGQEKHAQLA